MRVLGIDFGTSNTVAMLRSPDGRFHPLLFDGSPMMPSAVYLAPDGEVLVGREAEHHASADPTRFEPNPKRRIDESSIVLGHESVPVARLVGRLLEHVLTEVRQQTGGDPRELRMTYPARWAEHRRSVVIEAARLAGLPRPKLIAESVGAASYFTAVLGTAVPVDRSLAIYDLGGGTFNATVVRRTQTGFELLAEEGLPDLGGVDFDHAVVEHLGRTYFRNHWDVWTRLFRSSDLDDRRALNTLYEDVRRCKELLSTTSTATVQLPVLDVEGYLTRDELESLVRQHLASTVDCLGYTIRQSGLEPRDLVGVFLVGGSSRIPAVAEMIESELGVTPTSVEQPETVVVEGALAVGRPSRSGRRPAAGARAVPVSAGHHSAVSTSDAGRSFHRPPDGLSNDSGPAERRWPATTRARRRRGADVDPDVDPDVEAGPDGFWGPSVTDEGSDGYETEPRTPLRASAVLGVLATLVLLGLVIYLLV